MSFRHARTSPIRTGMLPSRDEYCVILTDRTRLVAFTHCSNIVGSIHDVAQFAAVIREAGKVIWEYHS